jgi:Rrf2 family protein
MRVSMKADYGMRAMIDLAQHYGQGAVQTAEIARRQDIPEPYLDQLLTALRKAGFIKSRRGPQGGHVLSRPPTQITMGEVVQALEGSMSPLPCLDTPEECSNAPGCVQRDIWLAVAKATNDILFSTTIAALAERQGQREKAGAYQI